MSQGYLVIVVLGFAVLASACTDLYVNLPPEHVSLYFSRFPSLRKKCAEEFRCPYQNIENNGSCWGYEDFCNESKKYTIHSCSRDAAMWLQDEKEQSKMFWSTADFGYVKKRLKELYPICKGQHENDSSLICSRHLRFCKATGLYLDFRKARLNLSTDRFREDVFKEGGIGGHCILDRSKLKESGDHKSALQSWFAELESYSELHFYPSKSSKHCDVTIDKPTIFMKLDAGVNMYHHFCDFVNLYVSQHINGSFSQDVQIVMWDTSPLNYGDFFDQTWKAFTHHPVVHLNQFDGKQVCIREAIFALLPRMRYGLYYNMPLIPGCWKSNLFRAFSRHITYRLGVSQEGPHPSKVRVTLLVRSTTYRRILNQDELLKALISHPRIDATLVDYNRNISFLDQLYVTHNSDVLIGMHGAGLTHLLFLPNWGAIFELYNCEDKDCYYDLSRLRGVKYFTWENLDKLVQQDEGHHPTLGAHQKFTNYSFDVDEFMRITISAMEYVESHREFVQARREKHPHLSSHASSPATGRSEL